ncbi:hypothetical protein ABT299_06420 [Spirillospora sp. NPDC000708]
MIQLEFGHPGGLGSSQGEQMPAKRQVIVKIDTDRAPSDKAVIQNNTTSNKGSGAHITSYRALRGFIESWLIGQTFLEAWERIHAMWVFTNDLADSWAGAPGLQSDSSKMHRYAVNGLIKHVPASIEDEWITRQGIPLKNAYWAEPIKVASPLLDKEPDDATRRELEGKLKRDRRIYIHSAQLEKYKAKPTEGYSEPKEWVPNLACHYIGAMTTRLSDWLQARNRFWFTSLNTVSYRTGEADAARELKLLLAQMKDRPALNNLEYNQIAQRMLVMFDFFPERFGDDVTIEHASACAARHVVEYFQYTPLIHPNWRDSIYSMFMGQWLQRIDEDIERERENPDGKRNLAGLRELLGSSRVMREKSESYFNNFAKSITWPQK